MSSDSPSASRRDKLVGILNGVLSNHLNGVVGFVNTSNLNTNTNNQQGTSSSVVVPLVEGSEPGLFTQADASSIYSDSKKNQKQKEKELKDLQLKEKTFLEKAKFRRYRSGVEMTTKMKNMPYSTVKNILYEIGLRQITQSNLLIPQPQRQLRWGQTIKTTDIISQQLTSLHKKYSNFTGVYDYMDLAGIAYHLAKCIAKFNNTGTLLASEIRCGQPIAVRSLGIATEPVNASDNCVFIPRTTSTIMAPATFNALLSATNAYGSTVYTDVLELDGNNNPVVIDFSGSELVAGCFAALRVLLAMYSNCMQGGIIAYAIVKGYHYMNSVVAHTDEGGYVRDVLRQGDYVPPFGGINMDMYDTYSSMPMPNKGALEQICACVDTVLLCSAALVSVSDPCVEIDGRVYPRTYSDDKANSQNIALQIYSDGGQFAVNYIKNIATLFDVNDIDSHAVKHMQLSMARVAQTETRHLNYVTVAPYYWIEPTTLLPREFNSISESNGLSTLSSVGEIYTVDALPKAKIAMSESQISIVGYEHRSARTVPLLLFLQMHAMNGLANITPWNFMHEKMAFKGGDLDANASREAFESIDRYLWGRGQSTILAPAEMLYIGEVMGIKINHHTFENDLTISANHIYNSQEIVSAQINITCTRPTRVLNDNIAKFGKKIKLVRNSAIKALESAREYMRNLGLTGGETFVSSNTELVFIEKKTEFSGEVEHLDIKDIGLDETQRTSKTGPTIKKVFHDVPLKVHNVKNPPPPPTGRIVNVEPERDDVEREAPNQPPLPTNV